MKKLITAGILGAVIALSMVAPPAHARSSQQTGPTPTPAATVVAPPVQGAKKGVVLYVDTVQGAGGSPAPAVGCSQTNLFRQGQVVVFRMWGIDAKHGGVALTSKNVKSAVVTIPGQAPIQMVYGAHGKAPGPVVSFWSAPWKTSSSTALGVVNFTITVKTKANKKTHIKSVSGTFSQTGFSPSSQLTITP